MSLLEKINSDCWNSRNNIEIICINVFDLPTHETEMLALLPISLIHYLKAETRISLEIIIIEGMVINQV